MTEAIDMDAELQEMELRNKIATELREKNPKLPLITAIVMAGDMRSAERMFDYMKHGKYEYAQAVHLVGSYSTLNFALRAHEEGYATMDAILDELPDLWRGSDPDDTDPRFLDLWRRAWERNGRRYLRDGAALPRPHNLIVYRGQDENDPMGIAWTLDIEIARKFARGAGMRVSDYQGTVMIGKVARRDVLAYLTKRGEQELIIDPRNVKGISE